MHTPLHSTTTSTTSTTTTTTSTTTSTATTTTTTTTTAAGLTHDDRYLVLDEKVELDAVVSEPDDVDELVSIQVSLNPYFLHSAHPGRP